VTDSHPRLHRSEGEHFRVYEPEECGKDGYPLAWHKIDGGPGVKHLVREQAGHRCVRCRHPFECGVSNAVWSPCDTECVHTGPFRCGEDLLEGAAAGEAGLHVRNNHQPVLAHWRVLTVHHLRLGHDAKRDLRWWNLAALCQRCHLQIQGKVVMERVWPWPHSNWFKPYAAGWYAHAYLGEDLTREEVDARMDELLGLELAA
jgi:hypothetical protein